MSSVVTGLVGGGIGNAIAVHNWLRAVRVCVCGGQTTETSKANSRYRRNPTQYLLRIPYKTGLITT